MARTVHHVSFLVILETLCSKGHSLVEGYVVANDGCLAYHHSRTMVNTEILTDSGSRMDVNTCFGVGR